MPGHWVTFIRNVVIHITELDKTSIVKGWTQQDTDGPDTFLMWS